MGMCSDFLNEEGMMQHIAKSIGVIVLLTPKCHGCWACGRGCWVPLGLGQGCLQKHEPQRKERERQLQGQCPSLSVKRGDHKSENTKICTMGTTISDGVSCYWYRTAGWTRNTYWLQKIWSNCTHKAHCTVRDSSLRLWFWSQVCYERMMCNSNAFFGMGLFADRHRFQNMLRKIKISKMNKQTSMSTLRLIDNQIYSILHLRWLPKRLILWYFHICMKHTRVPHINCLSPS